MNLKLEDFDFDLDANLIADFPAIPRDASSLLVFSHETISKTSFSHVFDYLPSKTVLIFNNTKVYKARLTFEQAGRTHEIFVLGLNDDQTLNCMVRPGKYFKVGSNFKVSDCDFSVVGINSDGTRNIEYNSNVDIYSFLDSHGSVPLPPYIKQDDPNKFEESYQTVYAQNVGSVAAPTAGLHFTEELLASLKESGVIFKYVSLNVGLGTFAPLKDDEVSGNKLHKEYCVLDPKTAAELNSLRSKGYKLVSVGTTSLRTLQSAWNSKEFVPFEDETDIFIYPPYDNWSVDGLITNFHLPKSSLFILVSAFIGRENALKVYQFAIDNRLRFYSFGDACLFWR